MDKFSENVISIVKNIPKGKVMTYGFIAAIAGNHRGARQVARLLHSSSSKYNLPWQRVINSKGKISLTYPFSEEQKDLLIKEGVEFISENEISLDIYLWKIKSIHEINLNYSLSQQ